MRKGYYEYVQDNNSKIIIPNVNIDEYQAFYKLIESGKSFIFGDFTPEGLARQFSIRKLELNKDNNSLIIHLFTDSNYKPCEQFNRFLK